MENSRFDDIIKSGLENLNPEYDPASWQALSDSMSNQEDIDFDDQVKKELEDNVPAYEAASWDVLSARMQTEEDLEFDSVVREELKGDMSSPAGDSWLTLLTRLESWEQVRREFWVLRTAEAAIILLLILAFYQFGQKGVIHEPHPVASNAITKSSVNDNQIDVRENLPDIREDLLQRDQSLISENVNSPDNLVHQSLQSGNLHSNEIESVPSKLMDADVVSDDSKNKVVETKNGVYPVSNMAVSYSLASEPSDDIHTPITESVDKKATDYQKVTMRLSPPMRKADGISFIDDFRRVSNIEKIYGHMSLLEYSEVNEYGLSDHLLDLTDHKSPVWVSFQSHTALNLVHTPAGDNFNAQNSYTLGYGLGVLISFQHDRLTWESGAEYQVSNFSPKRSKLTGNIIDGYRTTKLSDVNVEYINIPLQVRYKLWRTAKHELYALAGLKLHISSKVDFDFVDKTDQDNTGPIDYNSLGEPEDIIGVDASRFTYFSLNAGIGYQRVMNTRSKLFVQPSFEYFAENQGIVNLNGEKVNTLRLDFGVRVRI